MILSADDISSREIWEADSPCLCNNSPVSVVLVVKDFIIINGNLASLIKTATLTSLEPFSARKEKRHNKCSEPYVR